MEFTFMSLIILFLIIILLYASLSTYGNIFKVLLMTIAIFGMTSTFLVYGLDVFSRGDIFAILDTRMNKTLFVHACAIWFAADMLVLYRIIKSYMKYLEVNAD